VKAFKPCPFCGKAPRVYARKGESLWSHNIVDWHYVRCDDCDIEMSECEDIKALRERWNTRQRAAKATQTHPAAILEEP